MCKTTSHEGVLGSGASGRRRGLTSEGLVMGRGERLQSGQMGPERTWLRLAGQPGGLEGTTRRGCSGAGERGPGGGRGAGRGQCWRWSPGRRARGRPGRVMLPAVVSMLGGGEAHLSEWPPLPHAPGSREFF